MNKDSSSFSLKALAPIVGSCCIGLQPLSLSPPKRGEGWGEGLAGDVAQYRREFACSRKWKLVRVEIP